MRSALVGIVLAVAAWSPMDVSSALAGEALPAFEKHTPYPTVRAQLIRMGYAPARVSGKPGARPPCQSSTPLCRKYPEVVSCTGMGALFCLMLFERPSDARQLIVVTGGEPLDYRTPPDFTTVEYLELFRPRPGDLKDVIIASGDRRASPPSR